MDEKELQEIVEKHSSDFKIFIENESFLVDKIKMSQTASVWTILFYSRRHVFLYFYTRCCSKKSNKILPPHKFY